MRNESILEVERSGAEELWSMGAGRHEQEAGVVMCSSGAVEQVSGVEQLSRCTQWSSGVGNCVVVEQ